MRKQCHKHEKYAMRYIQLGWNLDFCHSCHVTLMASHWVKHCLILVVCVCDRVVKVDQIDICDLSLWNVICCFQSLVEKISSFVHTQQTSERKGECLGGKECLPWKSGQGFWDIKSNMEKGMQSNWKRGHWWTYHCVEQSEGREAVG